MQVHGNDDLFNFVVQMQHVVKTHNGWYLLLRKE